MADFHGIHALCWQTTHSFCVLSPLVPMVFLSNLAERSGLLQPVDLPEPSLDFNCPCLGLFVMICPYSAQQGQQVAHWQLSAALLGIWTSASWLRFIYASSSYCTQRGFRRRSP